MLRRAAQGALSAAFSPFHSASIVQRGAALAAASTTSSLSSLTTNNTLSHTHQALPTPVFPRIKALLVDAAGTLLYPSEPAAAVYLRYAGPHLQVPLQERDVLQRFRAAYNSQWSASPIRYVGDGRPFWRHIVSQSTGCDSREVFEQIYSYYEHPRAWKVTPGAVQALQRLKNHGVKLAVVSNFDTRLRPLLDSMDLSHLFDQIIVSAEVGVEKPCPLIFEEACTKLGLRAHEVVHLGDDRRNDIWGARDAGITAWLWGTDVTSFDEVADKVLRSDRQI